MNSQLSEIPGMDKDEFERQCNETNELAGLINKLLVEKDRDVTVCMAALLDVLIVSVREFQTRFPETDWPQVCKATIVHGLEEEQPAEHIH